MTIEMNDNLLGTWFIQISSKQDFLAGLSRRAEGGFTLLYRFRYYSTPKSEPFEGKDEKNWYRVTILKEDDEEVIDEIRMMMKVLELGSGELADEILREGRSTDEMAKDLQGRTYAHTQWTQ